MSSHWHQPALPDAVSVAPVWQEHSHGCQAHRGAKSTCCLPLQCQPPLFWPHFNLVLKAWPLHETFLSPVLGKYTAAAACLSCSQMHLLRVQALIHYFYTESPLMAVTYGKVLICPFTHVPVFGVSLLWQEATVTGWDHW